MLSIKISLCSSILFIKFLRIHL